MKIVKIIFIVLVVLIGGAVIAGMFMPSRFTLDRSTVINADQKIIYDQINVLKNWEQWSPWMKMDPETKLTYDGPESGVGASYTFVSDKLGEGTITISESIPYESVALDMDFKGNGKALAGFKIAKEGNGNKVTWWFESDNGSNPFKKLMAVVMGKMMLTKAYDQGLEDLKKIAESQPSAAPEILPAAPDTLSTSGAH